MSTWDKFNTPGPTPGPKGVVKQHHAMASGYEVPQTPCNTELHQPKHTTGTTHAPGLTHMGRRSKKKGR